MDLSVPVCIAPVGDWCGEAPVWCAEEQAVYWSDINRFLIHRLNVRRGSVKSWLFDEPVTALALTDRADTILVALGSRMILWSPKTGEMRDQGFRLGGWPHVRLNDGRPDPRGSFWVGSMRNNVGPDGAPGEIGGADGVLFCIHPDGSVSEWKRGIGISNTLAWSPDRKVFYFGDSMANAIYSYEYDDRTGVIRGEGTFLAGFTRGAPDGSAVDGQGYLWNCRYNGRCIVRVAPDGIIDRVIEMPVSNITSCTFGGDGYETLYVTTASLGVHGRERLAGGLFAIRTGIAGQPENRFALGGSS